MRVREGGNRRSEGDRNSPAVLILSQPIRGKYSGHVTCLDQSEASILVSCLHLTIAGRATDSKLVMHNLTGTSLGGDFSMFCRIFLPKSGSCWAGGATCSHVRDQPRVVYGMFWLRQELKESPVCNKVLFFIFLA